MLCLGFGLGEFAHHRESWHPFVEALDPFGQLWVNLLRVTAVPLTLCLLVTGLGSLQRGAGRWTAVTMISILTMLVTAALFTVAVTYGFLGVAPLQPLPSGDGAPRSGEDMTFATWVANLVPKNAFSAAASEDVLGLTILAGLFGLALARIEETRRDAVLRFFEGARDVLFVIVKWALYGAPIGAFALAMSFTSKNGLSAAGAAGQYVLLACGMLVAFMLMLYPVATWAGRFGIKRFAMAVAPVQVVALGTRSSLACLPSLVDAAESLDLREEAKDVSLPMTIALFKLNRPITAISRTLFLAALYSVPMDAGKLTIFALTVLALSIASPGIPNSGGGSTTGAYLAAGLPIEGIVLLDMLTPITDLFRTLLNATANLVAAVLAHRFAGEAA